MVGIQYAYAVLCSQHLPTLQAWRDVLQILNGCPDPVVLERILTESRSLNTEVPPVSTRSQGAPPQYHPGHTAWPWRRLSSPWANSSGSADLQDFSHPAVRNLNRIIRPDNGSQPLSFALSGGNGCLDRFLIYNPSNPTPLKLARFVRPPPELPLALHHPTSRPPPQADVHLFYHREVGRAICRMLVAPAEGAYAPAP